MNFTRTFSDRGNRTRELRRRRQDYYELRLSGVKIDAYCITKLKMIEYKWEMRRNQKFQKVTPRGTFTGGRPLSVPRWHLN